tara:strand:- start:703 stop:2136 length:1434 start_codon:yes stop_codon:yes gene_type:complete
MAKKKKGNLLYIMNPNCGWCKKADPVVEELVKDGYKIKTLNVQNQDDAIKAREAITKHGIQCGTPLFLDSKTGNMVCGFREKDILEKWANGEEMPAPPPREQPQQPQHVEKETRVRLEYIWLDGKETTGIRSKIKFENIKLPPVNPHAPPPIDELMGKIPDWSFDGSSTSQAEVENSDLILKPVKIVRNSLERQQPGGQISLIVLCEVFNVDGTPHESNARYNLRSFVDENEMDDLVVSSEQEYVFWNHDLDLPSGWESSDKDGSMGEPSNEGDYYCGFALDNSTVGGTHRMIADFHANVCGMCDISLSGYNAEVMKSQWEYQTAPSDVLTSADNLWISRYLLMRISEQRGLGISFDPKPVDGNYNGSGCHINFSTKTMREGSNEIVEEICESLALNHEKAISSYGVGNDKRLTGKNETSKIDKFTYGKGDRSCSLRIPVGDYLEDRRPAANVDPYVAFLNLSEVLTDVNNKVLERV